MKLPSRLFSAMFNTQRPPRTTDGGQKTTDERDASHELGK